MKFKEKRMRSDELQTDASAEWLRMFAKPPLAKINSDLTLGSLRSYISEYVGEVSPDCVLKAVARLGFRAESNAESETCFNISLKGAYGHPSFGRRKKHVPLSGNECIYYLDKIEAAQKSLKSLAEQIESCGKRYMQTCKVTLASCELTANQLNELAKDIGGKTVSLSIRRNVNVSFPNNLINDETERILVEKYREFSNRYSIIGELIERRPFKAGDRGHKYLGYAGNLFMASLGLMGRNGDVVYKDIENLLWPKHLRLSTRDMHDLIEGADNEGVSQD